MSVTDSGSTLGAIRARTRQAHLRLERRLRLTRAPTRASYAAYLARMLELVAAVEARVATDAVIAELLPDVGARSCKSSALREDLAELGLGGAAGGLPQLPATRDAAELLGLLYVFEGATLGGAVLARELEAQLGRLPTRYLRCYGGALGERWRTFCAALDAGVHPSARDRVAASAERGFEIVERWLDEHGLLSIDDESCKSPPEGTSPPA